VEEEEGSEHLDGIGEADIHFAPLINIAARSLCFPLHPFLCVLFLFYK